MTKRKKWVRMAMELQSLAQSALHYCKDGYDIERFRRIREISAEMVALHTDIEVKKVEELFRGDTGYQTPKIDTRGAVFQHGKVLLVRETSGRWSLPGGWCDYNLSPADNTVKEVREEAGLMVTADRLIAVQDRDRHNTTPYAYKIIKLFFLCTATGGAFAPNMETTAAEYFDETALPPLDTDKCTAGQIALCFEAARSPAWETRFD